LFKQILAVVLFCGFVASQTNGPERHVEGNRIVSQRDPTMAIQLPKAWDHVGADRWVLYGVADCELHAFVEPGGPKNGGQQSVRRLFWVQFEGYLPSKPELSYQYDSPRHTNIHGVDFFVDTWVRANNAETRSGSDREHMEAMIRAKGYKMPAGMMYVRLVHLLDDHKRKELMIIYGEDLTPTGFTVADLQEGGKAHDQWPAIEKGLIERAEEQLALEETGKR